MTKQKKNLPLKGRCFVQLILCTISSSISNSEAKKKKRNTVIVCIISTIIFLFFLKKHALISQKIVYSMSSFSIEYGGIYNPRFLLEKFLLKSEVLYFPEHH